MAPSPIVPIIGGGPAGMSCALWLANYGLRPVILERAPALGGMARRNPFPNPWLLGWPDALARDQSDAFARHIVHTGVETWLDAAPQRLARGSDRGFTLDVATGGAIRTLAGRALVLATGTEFRGEDWLARIPNAQALAARGRVLVGPAAIGEPGAALGPHVAIVGGGDNAFDVAHILLERGIAVTILMRDKTPRAQARLIERVLGRAAVRADRWVEALEDAGGKVGLLLNDGTRMEADQVVLLFGYRPNTGAPWLADLNLRNNADGYLIVDSNQETSCPGVFAVGDVANPARPCVATAVASGTVAAREIQKRLT
jgi:thioredoxin reductase (NADPH)